MKINNAHYEHMKNQILPLMGQCPESVYLDKGLSPKRYRWDLLRAAGLSGFTCDVLYKYLNDGHIDTALRNITNEVNKL